MSYLGDFTPGKTIRFGWNSYAIAGESITRGTNGTVSVYKDGSTTQSTAGITDTEDFDSLAGLHLCTIDTSVDGTFYSAGSDFMVVVIGAVIDGKTVNPVIGHFSLANRSALRPTVADRTLDVSAGGEAGMDWANVGSPATTLNLSGTTVKTATDVEMDTADIQSRLPSALVGGKIDASVGAYQSGQTPLQPTVAGRTLDVTATGAAGVDWGNVENPTTAVNLSATNIDVDQVVASVNGAVGSVTAAVTVTGTPAVNVAQISGDSVAADNLEAAFDGTGVTLTGVTVPTVTTLTNAPPDSAGVTTLLNRIGAFTGTGVNTLFGFLKALMSKAATTPSDVGGTFDPATDSVEAIRDTAPLGTAMRGTDNALLATSYTAPLDATATQNAVNAALIAYDVAAVDDLPAEPDNAGIGAIKVVTDGVATMLQPSGGNKQFTADALENAPTGGGASAADIADAVWDEPLSGHATAGSAGAALNAAGSGGASITVQDILEADPADYDADPDSLAARVIAIQAKSALLTTGTLNIRAPVDQDGNIYLTLGEDNNAADGMQIDLTFGGYPSFIGATAVVMRVANKPGAATYVEFVGSALSADTLRFQPMAADKAPLAQVVTTREPTTVMSFEVAVTLASGRTVKPTTVRGGRCTVTRAAPDI